MSVKSTIRALLIVLAIIAAIAGPRLWSFGALQWAKHSARRTFDRYKPETKQILNTTPVRIDLSHDDAGVEPSQTEEYGHYLVTAPRHLFRKNEKWAMILAYRGFEVCVVRPSSTSAADGLAQQQHFKNYFDFCSTSYQARLDDLDAQSDLESVKRFLLLIGTKPTRLSVREEFVRGEMCGFVYAPDAGRTVAEIYIPARQLGCGLWFMDKGALTPAAMHQFLSVFRIDPMPPAPATAPLRQEL